MVRRTPTCLRLKDASLVWIDREADRLGVTRSELLRRAVAHGLGPACRELESEREATT